MNNTFGEEAIRIIQSQPINLVILDSIMPKWSIIK